MSLNTWSLIVFSTYALFYLGMMLAMNGKASKTKLSIMIAAWAVNQLTVTAYGFATHQLGFILIGIFQMIASLITMIAVVGKDFSNENK